MVTFLLLLSFFFGLSQLLAADDYHLHRFQRHQLTDVYYSEGANFGDVDRDGISDVVHGPFWFAGPEFKNRREIYLPREQPRHKYADSFFSWLYDVDRDGWKDVLAVGFPGTPAYVYRNPGERGYDEHWAKHEVLDWVSNESPQFTNIVGDATWELICTRDGRFGYATIGAESPLSEWTFYAISEKVASTRFGHGLGVGDIDGDARIDVITKDGWFRQPESVENDPLWEFHRVPFARRGGADMWAYDVDGDGDNDVISSLAAHEFGLAWFEQIRAEGRTIFRKHLIMGDRPEQNRYGILFSELHAVALVDMDGDGLKDIVTGKTYWSHHTKSPMWDAGAVVYWFKLVRGEKGVDWIPYQADAESGIGRQLSVGDINGDSLPDIVVGGMKGAHVLVHERQVVDADQWKRGQPKPIKNFESKQIAKGPAAPIDTGSGRVAGAVEGQSMKVLKRTGGNLAVQQMDGFSGDRWSGADQLYWNGAAPGDQLELELLVKKPGRYVVEIVMTRARDYAVVKLALDGKWLGKRIDLYNANVVTTGVLSLGRRELKAGPHRLSVEIVGSNPAAVKEYMVGLDYVRIVPEDAKTPVPAADKPALPAGPSGASTPSTSALTPDEYPHSGLTPEQAAGAMQLPDGFTVTVCAAEPDVKQPIAMAIDDRGRVWIAEAYEYPRRANDGEGRDRILVFEDTNGDGTFDKRTVFAENLNLVSGLEVGFGGVWVGAAPHLLFIPDRDGDDVPDTNPEVLLDGWGYQDTHETLNAFIWGPDGWLYGCHGVFTHSIVGRPTAADEERVPLNAAIWRYHPTRHVFEVFAHGTSNPWGVDFNDHGQTFCTACVIPHLYHVIQGARYQRQAGQHFNPYTYQDIATIADHRHYLGAKAHLGNDKSDSVGGGHAHAGAMIYLGGAWPQRYRNQIFMNNIHGQRVNMDTLHARGSGYVGGHGPDFLLTGDRASQMLNFRYGPDGQVYMIDWYDMQACHTRNRDDHDRSNGRIYKVVYGDPAPVAVNLAELGDLQLAEMVLSENDWYVRHARRQLQERAAAGTLDVTVRQRLSEIASTHDDATRRLRAIWALHVTGGLHGQLAAQLLDDPSPYVRGWAIQLSVESTKPSLELLGRLAVMARDDNSPIVRLYLASALQRFPIRDRWEILGELVKHAVDADDHNLPLMYWYAAEPLAEADPQRALAFGLAAGESIPLIRDFMLRRIGSSGSSASLAVLIRGLREATAKRTQLTFLDGIRTALRGRRRIDPPAQWAETYRQLVRSDDPQVLMQAMALAVIFGDAAATRKFREIAESGSADAKTRRDAIETLIAVRDRALPSLLQHLVADSEFTALALRGLGRFSDPQTPRVVLAAYPKLSLGHRRSALATLCGRAEYGIELLRAIERKEIAGTDLPADLVRQLQNLGNERIEGMLNNIWGSARETEADKAALITSYKRMISESPVTPPDHSFGRAIFTKTCWQCHTLYGTGGKIGPDLTGSNRADLDYLLANIVDPSAIMAKEYQPSVLVTIDGLVVTGIVQSENQQTITVQTADDTVSVPKEDIEERQLSIKSMMPDGQLEQLTDHEVRSLLAYLSGKSQVSLLATTENASLFFNGEDLAGWSGNPQLWRVEDGQIIGQTSADRSSTSLVSDLAAEDFRLKLQIKLSGNEENSGIQFRSRLTKNGELKGYLADVGAGSWGKLYEKRGRGLLWKQSGEQYVRAGEWNTCEIEANGERIRTWINGQLCADLVDTDGASRGIFALQLQSIRPTEVRFRNLKLEILNKSARSAEGPSDRVKQ